MDKNQTTGKTGNMNTSSEYLTPQGRDLAGRITEQLTNLAPETAQDVLIGVAKRCKELGVRRPAAQTIIDRAWGDNS